mmetsp:Transcript_32451/g.64695  ORF Transcript_32451/g.64695 Transcript_32451/m.64695 type:complete len:206 (-) Transcript_32451:181-798(-)|eukprot:CAMPEP_0174704036 /NCGR_PEP_ID=MMETSP1094-20130205/7776_1 /TAXON_ID=156173 /ORGANISM="Chrysochromulina brevifilum, Strain UTEX LB 985" /LENGTH=205 /DNA_ID=CAMNT_0015902039 /DNA_START=66 /DNA_END=683 /DNA_ORIENTATION=+
MSSRRVGSPQRAGGAGAGKVGRRPSGGSSGGPTPTLSTNNSRRSTPSSSPASSGDRQPQRTAAYQKAKSGANRGLRADPDALSGKPAATKAAAAGVSRGVGAAIAPTPPAEDDDEPFVPDEEEEGPSTQGDGLNAAKARRQRSFETAQELPELDQKPPEVQAEPEEEEFVPEEEEEGPSTQGDGLMAAKRRMQRGQSSPTMAGLG